jgi:hypothetical protein
MAPCSWPVSYAACSSCNPLDSASALDRAAFEEMASTYLWLWTLRQFGVCSVLLRPCRSDCSELSTFWGRGPYPWETGAGPGISWPALVGGKWYSLRSCGCAAACSCAVPNSLELPGPVSAVTQVLIDGVVVNPGAYRVDGDLLIRTDGQSWPSCQNLALPSTSAGTWQITYDRGVAVPAGGQIAAGVLACEMAKVDNFTGIEKGHTGIWIIDSWVSSIVQPVRGGRVYSVDLPATRAGRLSSL